jgi:uncharacterized peroxidase-related enzyme
MSAVRIPMLERDQVPPEMANLYDALLATRGVVPNMFKTLAHIPPVAAGFAAFLKPLMSDGTLPGWFKELVAIRVGFLNRCEYCVAAHTLSARQKGAPEEKLRAVTADFESGPYTDPEKIAFRCAGILHASPQGVDDAFFAQLRQFYTEPQLVELFATIGAFEMFPRLIDGLKIPVTPLPAGVAEKKG